VLDFSRCDDRDLDLARTVATFLQESSKTFRPERAMLVGAVCRDLLHKASGSDHRLRATNDVDIGVALSEWSAYNDLVDALGRPGPNGIQFSVGGIPVDLLPFGAVEQPAGTVRPPTRSEGLSVFGFQQVFDAALQLEIAPDITMAIPTIAGYTGLKMAAWADRSIVGEYKDGPDLAVAVSWYDQSSEVTDRLYDSSAGQATLQRFEFDGLLSAAALLGADLAAELGPDLVEDLRSPWIRSRLDLLPTYLGNEFLPGWPADQGRRAAIATALASGLWPEDQTTLR